MSAVAPESSPQQEAVCAAVAPHRLNVLVAKLQPALARWVLFRRDDVCARLSIPAAEAEYLIKRLLELGQIALAKDGTGGLYLSLRKSD